MEGNGALSPGGQGRNLWALGWWSLQGGRRSQGPRRGDGQPFRGEEPHLRAEGRVGEAEELPSLEPGSSWAEGRAGRGSWSPLPCPPVQLWGRDEGAVTPPRTGDAGAVSGRPGTRSGSRAERPTLFPWTPWGSGLLVYVCLHSHLSSPSASHPPLSGAQVPASSPASWVTLGRFHCLPELGFLIWKMAQGHHLAGLPQGTHEQGCSPRLSSLPSPRP